MTGKKEVTRKPADMATAYATGERASEVPQPSYSAPPQCCGEAALNPGPDDILARGRLAHSTRSARIGSTLAARCAGITAASSAARLRITVVATSTAGSAGRTL